MGIQFFRATSSPAAKSPASPDLSQPQYPIPWSLLVPQPQGQDILEIHPGQPLAPPAE